jgi:hypothetical protein
LQSSAKNENIAHIRGQEVSTRKRAVDGQIFAFCDFGCGHHLSATDHARQSPNSGIVDIARGDRGCRLCRDLVVGRFDDELSALEWTCRNATSLVDPVGGKLGSVDQVFAGFGIVTRQRC